MKLAMHISAFLKFFLSQQLRNLSMFCFLSLPAVSNENISKISDFAVCICATDEIAVYFNTVEMM